MILLVATPAPAQDSRVRICSVDRLAPIGRLRAYQIFGPEGDSGARVTTWEAELAPGGLSITARWNGRAPVTDPNDGWVMISFMPPSPYEYRMEIRREEDGPVNDLRLGGILQRPNAGPIDWFTTWSTLSGAAQGAPNFQVVILDFRGRIVRRGSISPEFLSQVHALGIALQAEMDRLAANYRSCDLLPMERDAEMRRERR